MLKDVLSLMSDVCISLTNIKGMVYHVDEKSTYIKGFLSDDHNSSIDETCLLN